MDIRLLNEDDMAMAKELWGYAFEKDEPFYSWYFNDYFQPENGIGVFSKGQLMSYLQMNPYELFLNGNTFKSSYVVGVITAPEYRNKGVMKRLLSSAMEEMNQRDHFVSILMPFDTTFYRPYGFELSYSQLKYEVPIDMIKDQSQRTGSFHRIHNDYETLSEIYNGFVKNNHGYVVRSDRNWEVILKDLSCYGGHGIILRDDHQNAVGYILYHLKGDRFVATEIVYTNPWAKASLFGFMYSHKSQVTTLEWSAPLSDRTYLSLRDTIQPKSTNHIGIRPFMCGRVVNVEKALKSCRFPDHIDGDFSMEILDPYGPWNEKCFHISIEKGIPKVETSTGSGDVTLTINLFTQLFFGALSFDEALASDPTILRHPSAMDLLSKVFFGKNNYINEFF